MIHPDLMMARAGDTITTAAQWPARRQELLDILDREQYSLWPDFTGTAQGSVCEEIKPCCAGHACHERLSISFQTPAGAFAFPMHFVFPADGQAHPLLHINFHPELYNPYCPVEEIIDNSFALGYVCYQDVTTDNDDMSNGLAACYPRSNPSTDWGKLSMWAFAASRALDILLTRPEVDAKNAAIIGHSRLGKAALLCGAHDERVRFVLANCSGCGGDALEQTKHPGAEHYAFMDRTFSYWFCGNRKKYIEDQRMMPYDQHFLLAAIAPGMSPPAAHRRIPGQIRSPSSCAARLPRPHGSSMAGPASSLRRLRWLSAPSGQRAASATITGTAFIFSADRTGFSTWHLSSGICTPDFQKDGTES